MKILKTIISVIILITLAICGTFTFIASTYNLSDDEAVRLYCEDKNLELIGIYENSDKEGYYQYNTFNNEHHVVTWYTSIDEIRSVSEGIYDNMNIAEKLAYINNK